MKVAKVNRQDKEMKHTASMRAPASMVNSPVSASFTTDAVRPAADEALPLV